jgi:hypothetical protein
LAAARTMVGPPMSMFSMASSSVQSGFATVCAERVEVHHHQVDGGMPCAAMAWPGAPAGRGGCEDAAVHLRVQGLDAAVEHFREAGVVGDFGDRQAGFAQHLGGAAGGQELDAERGQGAGEVDDAASCRKR